MPVFFLAFHFFLKQKRTWSYQTSPSIAKSLWLLTIFNKKSCKNNFSKEKQKVNSLITRAFNRESIKGEIFPRKIIHNFSPTWKYFFPTFKSAANEATLPDSFVVSSGKKKKGCIRAYCDAKKTDCLEKFKSRKIDSKSWGGVGEENEQPKLFVLLHSSFLSSLHCFASSPLFTRRKCHKILPFPFNFSSMKNWVNYSLTLTLSSSFFDKEKTFLVKKFKNRNFPKRKIRWHHRKTFLKKRKSFQYFHFDMKFSTCFCGVM